MSKTETRTHSLPDKAVEAVAEAMSCGVCQTCGTPATGSHGGVTECNCIRPTWREATVSEKARAAITAYLSALAAEGLVVVPRRELTVVVGIADRNVTAPAIDTLRAMIEAAQPATEPREE